MHLFAVYVNRAPPFVRPLPAAARRAGGCPELVHGICPVSPGPRRVVVLLDNNRVDVEVGSQPRLPHLRVDVRQAAAQERLRCRFPENAGAPLVYARESLVYARAERYTVKL